MSILGKKATLYDIAGKIVGTGLINNENRFEILVEERKTFIYIRFDRQAFNINIGKTFVGILRKTSASEEIYNQIIDGKVNGIVRIE